MKRSSLYMVAVAAIGFSTSAVAQNAAVWSDIDCSQSKIVTPSGLRCRATNEMAGSNTGRFNGNGVFRTWATFGKQGGKKLYFLVYEAVSLESDKQVYMTLQDEISGLSPYARGGRDFTSPSQMSGGDYVRFIGKDNGPCVAIRKVGPIQGKGYKWVLFGNECVSPGKGISDQEIGRFIQAADFHS